MEHSGRELSLQEKDAALAEIEGALDKMLTLSLLSPSDLDVDRQVLQKTLERLQDKIDRIAGGLSGG